jgi:hypothetical protein
LLAQPQRLVVELGADVVKVGGGGHRGILVAMVGARWGIQGRQRVGIHIRRLDAGCQDDEFGKPGVESKHRLELSDATGRIAADGVVGEADDLAAGGGQVILAEPVVGERLPRAVILEPVKLNTDALASANHFVVDPVLPILDAYRLLGDNILGDAGTGSRGQHPT